MEITLGEVIDITLGVFKRIKNWPVYFLDKSGLVTRPYLLQLGEVKIKLRPNNIDRWIVTENLIQDQYFLRSIPLGEFDQVIDIGGNIGSFSLAVSSLSPRPSILCFEPDPDNFSLLTENIKLNSLGKRFKLFNSAVSASASQKIKLFLNHDAATHSIKIEGSSHIEVENFPISKLLALIKKKSLLKLDIEGGEYDFFTPEFINLLTKFDMIIMEYHDLNQKLNLLTLTDFLSRNHIRYAKFGRVLHIYP
jgi:FkbM family methyltransferase